MIAKRVALVVVALAVVVGLGAVRARRAAERAGAPLLEPQPPTFEVATATRGTLQARHSFLGQVGAREEVPLSSRIVSQVLAVNVREGDRVRRGAVLVELDQRELDDAVASGEAAALAAREAQVAAQVAYDAQVTSTARDKRLVDADAIARDEWERSQAAEAAANARLQAAQAQAVAAARSLASARTRRGYATIRAPFDAVVSARAADPGDLAAPGKPLVSLARRGGVRVRISIPAERLRDVHPGTAVALHGAAGERRLPVSRVFPAMDSAHLATIEVDAPESADLPIGFTVPVDLLAASEPGLIVPPSALLETARGAFVFVVDGEAARPVAVTVLARADEGVAVSGDVREGARVATGTPSRLAMLTAGARIRVAEEK